VKIVSLLFAILNDSHTINSLRDGDQVAFRLVFDEYHGRIYAYIHKKTGSSYLAEETMQLTFVKLWKYRQSLKPELSLFTQIFRIASTTMIDLVRSEEKKRFTFQSIKKQADFRLDPLQSMEENDLKKKVNVLVRQMPTMQKKVFEMSRFEEKSYREIALALSISIKTVETHISRALKFLRQNLTLFSWLGFLFLCFF
jgi:RNA polymerase sigma-70 factor (family 1)